MPTGYVAKVAKEKGISLASAEKKWEEAKKAAESYKSKGEERYYKVVTSIFKKMMGINEEEFLTFKDWLKIS